MVEEEEKEEEGIRKEGNKSDKLNNDKQQTFEKMPIPRTLFLYDFFLQLSFCQVRIDFRNIF